ncbi:MAG: hypothetical protein ABIY70_04770 [Capsulimonas sp.]|uniref:hypothetical protein n=1 Tax=Capsulimonas sp. TaxID=2494211 RepID=UPI0032630574
MEAIDDYERSAMDWFLRTLQHTSNGTLYGATLTVAPETWHLFQSRQDLMTDDERAARLYLAMDDYANAFTTKRERVKGQNRAKRMLTPAIEAQLKDGSNAFLASVAARIVREHGAGVLNYCPKCGALARTPQSRQCPKCFHSWRNA